MHSFSSLYNENTVISKEHTGPLDFDITGVDCRHVNIKLYIVYSEHIITLKSSQGYLL